MTGDARVDSVILSVLSALIVALVTWLAQEVRSKTEDTLAYRREREGVERTRDMIIFRMAVYDEHFSVEEKLEAYQLYRSVGGNHKTKAYMDSLLGEDVDVYLKRHKEAS